MPDYSKLRGLTSHRVRIEYDTGAAIVGYLAECKPGEGPVQFVTISNAEMTAADGTVLESHEQISVPANVMTGIQIAEGPRGRSG